MSLLSRATRSGTRSPLGDLSAGRDDDLPGRYLTDGINLYRCVGEVASGMGQMVGLEDCRTLELFVLPVGELHSRQLRPVTAGEGG